MPTILPFIQSAFHPVLFSSTPLEVTGERRLWIRKVLDVIASDSQFAQKGYDAIIYILTSDSSPFPIVASLNPSSAQLGSPNFTLHVLGTGFTPTSVIIWNGSPEPTVYVSDSELTTEVDMSTAQVAIDIPVAVQEANGIMSDVMTFSLTAAELDATRSSHGRGLSKQAVSKGHEVTEVTEKEKQERDTKGMFK